MGAAVAMNQPVTLTGSDNKCLTYPVRGVIEVAELGVNNKPIWATFRREQPDGRLGCPVVVRNYTTA